MEQDVETDPRKENHFFKPYLDKKTDVGQDVYQRLIQAFTEMDRSERPWCGIGIKVDLLAISPKGVTVAVISEPSAEKGLVHLSQNWREPWQVETADKETHYIENNPCEQAERAISAIRDSLRSFLKVNDHAVLPSIKCLIIFPDAYDFEGPKDFSTLDRDEVITLKVRHLLDLPEAILQPAQQERLDSRRYRKWIETEVVRSNDESILGTWLDPAFDTPEPELPKDRFWWLSHPCQREVPAEEEQLASPGSSRMRPVPTKFKGRQLRLSVTVLAVMLIGIMAWRLYDVTRPITLLSGSRRSVSSPRPAKATNASQIVQASMHQEKPSLAKNEKRETVPAPETITTRGIREPELAAERKLGESAKIPRARTQASEDSELKGKKIELQIHDAILLRAISGVTVYFVGETAYLQGQVATENQKSAAEKAARSIPGVEEVRNSIEVNRFSPADG